MNLSTEPYSFREGSLYSRRHYCTGHGFFLLTPMAHTLSSSLLPSPSLSMLTSLYRVSCPQEPLSHLPAASTPRLQSALHTFALWLSSTAVDRPAPRLAQLALSALALRVHREALKRLVRTYRWFCKEVRSKESRYEAAATVLGGERPFGQVHLLWQIFGIEGEESGDEDEDEDGSEESGEGSTETDSASAGEAVVSQS